MALSELCIATKTSVGALIILSLLLSIIIYVSSIYFKKRKILKSLSKLLFVCGVGGGTILYLIIPFAVNSLLGFPNPSMTECQQFAWPPYCGNAYCEQNDYQDGGNCTCIQR